MSWLDEDPRDRDEQGVLWGRRSHTVPDLDTGQPTGTPQFAKIHSGRQHEVMSGMWCQVCRRNKASRTAEGWLFLVPVPAREPDAEPVPATWPEGQAVVHPPVCLADAHQSLRRCAKRHSLIAVRVRRPKLHGVWGDFYRPVPGGAEPIDPDGDGVLVPYRVDGRPNADLAYTLASQLVRVLHDCTPADLTTEPT